MDLNQRKEQFSVAYLRAVTAVAGYNLYTRDIDQDSVDWGIAAGDSPEMPRSPRIELQLKCAARQIRSEDFVRFPLKLKNYNDLRHPMVMVSRLLLVIIVSEKLQNWIQQSEEELVLRHCGYWLSLRGRPDVPNEESVTVHLPRSLCFTPEALREIMKRADNEEEL